ncbi:unnamed protein product [Victoria cruziana]
MALKFLNKKGWHTGSLRNIENVWKAEQKQLAEDKKLEEFKKQIQEERERQEFRLLQEQAGLVPKQERLEFLYDSGLAVGKSSSEGFKALEVETLPPAAGTSAAGTSKDASISTPGALFSADKPQSANDSWRKLHSDPLLLIRQKEQEALARIKNNPIKMDAIKRSMEDKKKKKKRREHKKSGHATHSRDEEVGAETDDSEGDGGRKRSHHYHDHASMSKKDGREIDGRMKDNKRGSQHDRADIVKEKDRREADEERTDRRQNVPRNDWKSNRGNEREKERKRSRDHDEYSSARKKGHENYYHDGERESRNDKYHIQSSRVDKNRDSHTRDLHERSSRPSHHEDGFKHGRLDAHPNMNQSGRLSEEEKAARLRQMQLDAEVHEDQRWRRLKKASEEDAKEESNQRASGRNFLDAAQRSIYGTEERGKSATIAESVRGRTFYLQGRLDADEGKNAFRR